MCVCVCVCVRALQQGWEKRVQTIKLNVCVSASPASAGLVRRLSAEHEKESVCPSALDGWHMQSTEQPISQLQSRLDRPAELLCFVCARPSSAILNWYPAPNPCRFSFYCGMQLRRSVLSTQLNHLTLGHFWREIAGSIIRSVPHFSSGFFELRKV